MTEKLAMPNVIAGRRNFLRAGVLGGSAAMLAAMNDGARAQGAPIPVGQAAPLTDFAAADGVEFQNGLTLACEEINALGGILAVRWSRTSKTPNRWVMPPTCRPCSA